MDFLDLLQSKYQKYHKKNNILEHRQIRVKNLQNTRRETRTQKMDQMRDLKAILTPVASRTKTPVPKKRVSPHIDRLTKLKIWKEERDKKRKEQKLVKKPVFKVGGAKDLGFPQLPPDLSSFAPQNHVFKPPKNIKPITSNLNSKSQLQRVTRSQKPVASPPLPLPARRKRAQKTIEKQIETKLQNKILTRQNATEETSLLKKSSSKSDDEVFETNSSVIFKTKKGRKSLRKSKNSTEQSEIETLLSEDEQNKIKSQLNDVFPTEDVQRKTPKARRNLRGKENQIQTEETQIKTPENRKSRRKSTRRTLSMNDLKENEKSPNVKNWSNITPENKNVYISPFVTTSRGKGSVKKENLERSMRGLPLFTESSSSSSGASYFLTVLNNEISRLQELCRTWTDYKSSDDVNLSEDAMDMIDVAVGQATLLMNKKFRQFEGLIHACQTGEGAEKEVTCEDLQGFWDMIYMQVENINTRFNRLTTMKNNNWEEIRVEPAVPVKVVKKRAPAKSTKPSATSGIRAAILAARKKKQESSAPLPTTSTQQSEEESVFNGGFFVVRTPHKNTPVKHTPTKHTPRPTPKSILKSTKKKSVANLNKSVLFKEEDDSEPESVLNTTFDKTPPKREQTPRRRRRSTKQ